MSSTTETKNSAQLKFLKEAESSEIPELSEIPEIPVSSGEDASLMEISEELSDIVPDVSKAEICKKI